MPAASAHMRITNLLTGTSPHVLHRNGNPPEWAAIWERAVDAFFRESLQPCPPFPDLTIVTWSNRPTKTVLERCLDRWGVSYLTLGRNVPEWRNDMKVYLNANELRRVKSKYVMALDSDDVLVVSCPQRIVADFESFGCDILFSTEKNSCPEVPFLTEFEQSISESSYCYLNSGAWVGKTEVCSRFFQDCLDEHNRDIVAAHPAPQTARDDQGLTRKTFRKYHPAARLDYRCRIFQSLFNVPIEGEILISCEPALEQAAVGPLGEVHPEF